LKIFWNNVARLTMLVASKTTNQYHIGFQSTTAQWFSVGKSVDDYRGIGYHQALSLFLVLCL